MPRIVAALVLNLIVAFGLSAQDPLPSKTRTASSPPSSSFILHVDVQRLKQSSTGEKLIQSLCDLPHVADQLDSIPRDLAFLKQARIDQLTISTTLPGGGGKPVLHVKADLDEQGFFRLIRHANGYARVDYAGVAIHHWMANLKSLGSQLMGDTTAAPEDHQTQPVFLACPRSGDYVVSTSLAALNVAIDRLLDDQPLFNHSQFVSRFGDDPGFVCYRMSGGKGFPGNLSCVLGEQADGQVFLKTAVTCKSDEERTFASRINNTLNDPDLAVKTAQRFFPGGQEARNSANAAIDREASGKPGVASPEHRNSLNLGLTYDSTLLDCDQDGDAIRSLVENCLDSRFEDDVLVIQARFYGGPFEIRNQHRDPEASVGSRQSRNSLDIKLNVFSTIEKRNEAIRIANARSGDPSGAPSEQEGTLIR